MNAAELPIREVIKELSVSLGYKITAYLGLADNTLIVQHWIDGKEIVSKERHLPFRTALQCVYDMRKGSSNDILIQTWFAAMNQFFNDRAPIFILRNATSQKECEAVLRALQSFIHT